ncbi:MAG: hypothetical protein WC718_11020 [Phycisphaerales bacterium]|jgi:hypothetical protein
MLSTFIDLAKGVGIALVITLVGLALIWRRSPASRAAASTYDPFRASLLSALLIAITLPLSILLGFAKPTFPPVSAVDWPVLFAFAGGIVGIVGALLAPRRPHAKPRTAGLAVFALLHLLLLALVAGAMRTQFSGPHAGAAIATAAAIGAAGTLVSLGFRAACASPGAIAPLLIVIVGTTSSLAAVLTGNIGSPTIYGIACACVGPAFLVALWRPAAALAAAFTGPAWLFAALCIVTTVIGETPWWCAGLNALAALMVYVSGLGALGRLAGVKAWAARLSLVGAPALAAVIIAAMNQPEPYA